MRGDLNAASFSRPSSLAPRPSPLVPRPSSLFPLLDSISTPVRMAQRPAQPCTNIQRGRGMKCQKCTKAATLHITEVLPEEQYEELHLCEECANKYLYEPQQKGMTAKGQDSGP